MVDIVNVVASGSLDVELDLNSVAVDIGPTAQYDPDKYPGLYLRFTHEAPLITLYRTGKYIVTGADSVDESYETREKFLNLLAEMDIIGIPEDEWFSVQNLVCTGELNQSLNLNTLAIGLGLEDTEYEPEQFPGLIFRPSENDCVVLLFATGKVVLTGISDVEIIDDTFRDIKQRIAELNSAG